MADHSKENHICKCAPSGVSQTLDEMDWERGIWYAALLGDVERVEALLGRRGAGEEAARATDGAGYTALHYAARAGHVRVCRTLLAHGAHVDARTKCGRATSLHRAAAAGRLDTVLFLLQSGACAEATDADGQTALHKAAEFNHTDVFSELLNFSSKLKDIQDKNGNTAFELLSSPHSDLM